MPVTTRRQTVASKNATNKKVDKEPSVPDDNHDSWDVPETNLESSIIKTYSKKQPFRTYQAKGLSKNSQYCHGVSSQPGWGSLASIMSF